MSLDRAIEAATEALQNAPAADMELWSDMARIAVEAAAPHLGVCSMEEELMERAERAEAAFRAMEVDYGHFRAMHAEVREERDRAEAEVGRLRDLINADHTLWYKLERERALADDERALGDELAEVLKIHEAIHETGGGQAALAEWREARNASG